MELFNLVWIVSRRFKTFDLCSSYLITVNNRLLICVRKYDSTRFKLYCLVAHCILLFPWYLSVKSVDYIIIYIIDELYFTFSLKIVKILFAKIRENYQIFVRKYSGPKILSNDLIAFVSLFLAHILELGWNSYFWSNLDFWTQ